jgi:pyrroloquinoline quinone (PQQ) biosynthesis protein C
MLRTNNQIDFCANFRLTNSKQAIARTANNGSKKLVAQWLIEHLCFVSSLVVADSFVLRNPPLRQAPKRYSAF